MRQSVPCNVATTISIALFSTAISTAAEPTKHSEAQAEALAFLNGRHIIDATIARNKTGEVVSVSIRCTHGLWDDPQPYDKTKWLPQFAERLQVFTKLKEVRVNGWVYPDDDVRHLARIPQLVGFSNGSAYGNAWPFTGSGLRHLIMPAKLHTLGLEGKGITDDSLQHVGRLTSLRKLHIFSKNVTDEGLRQLQPLDLCEFHLSADRVTDKGLQHLAHMHRMQILTLPYNEVADAALVHLAGMQELTELDLQDNKVTDAGLIHLGKLTGLNKLLLSGNDVAGDTEHLAKLHELEVLTLHGNENLGDAALPPLMGLPSLRTLTLANTRVTIDALRGFRRRRPDVQLSFRVNRVYGFNDCWHLQLDDDWGIRTVSFDKATDDDLAKFASMPELGDVESVSMPFPQRITGRGLVHLQAHKRITSLHLDECNIGDEGLQAIGHLKQLQRLEIDKGGITGEGLTHLAELTELRELTITNNDVTDDDLEFLRKMTKLESLNLSGTRVTAQGAARNLGDANHLIRLNLSSSIFRADHIVTGDALKRLLESAQPSP